MGWSKPTWLDTSDPTVNDDRSGGFTEGVFWVNKTSGDWFVLKDDAIGAASWTKIAASATSFRSGNDAVSTGGTTITFSSALLSTNYSITARCYDGNGNLVSYSITNKTVNGFTITPAINCTADWQAIPHV